MTDLVPRRLPWEPVPVQETVELLQRDFAYAVRYTAVVVHASRPEFQIIVNTRRGQIIPRGECKFTDGSAMELHDIGMPQPGCEEMTVKELMAWVWSVARELGLELER